VQLVILDSAQAIAQRAADEIEALLKDKPAAVLGTATGSSPLPLYDELTARCAAGRLSFAEVTGFMLDEYVGLPAGHPERYATFMETNLRSRVVFGGDVEAVPTQCITQGLATIMEARKLVLIATGEGKAEAIAQLVEGEVSAQWPATVMQRHDDALVLVDPAAASRLTSTH